MAPRGGAACGKWLYTGGFEVKVKVSALCEFFFFFFLCRWECWKGLLDGSLDVAE